MKRNKKLSLTTGCRLAEVDSNTIHSICLRCAEKQPRIQNKKLKLLAIYTYFLALQRDETCKVGLHLDAWLAGKAFIE